MALLPLGMGLCLSRYPLGRKTLPNGLKFFGNVYLLMYAVSVVSVQYKEHHLRAHLLLHTDYGVGMTPFFIAVLCSADMPSHHARGPYVTVFVQMCMYKR